MPLAPGSRLGPYQIVAAIGAGGMGEVSRATDTRLGRDVAVKVLPASVASDPDRRARFEREAKAVAALSHPNILAIFDFAVYDGVACAVTELLEGETLRAALEASGGFAPRKTIDIVVQIARGLAAAHERGIVHRDLKPENVFLTRDGHVKVLDFGLAKAIAPDRTTDTETLAGTDPGTAVGTVGYMAPEQVRGLPVDGRADLFALGAVFYEMLSGRRAFQRDTAAETMTAILREDPPEVASLRSGVPTALDRIVRHCLERNPAERFQSARDLIFSLQAATTASDSVPPVRERKRLAWRERTAWMLVAVLAAVLLTGGAAVWRRGERTSEPRIVTRFQVAAPDGSAWAAPLGAPEGSNGGTISPDGRTLTFVASDAGTPMLWVRPIDSYVARVLAGTEGASFPFWSPDSRSLGFFTQTRLKKITADGGPAQTLCEISGTPRGGSWSAQGVIVFATTGAQLHRISTDGGQPVPITKVDADNGGQQWPYFLPDGRNFLFYATSSRALFQGAVDATATKRLVAADSNAAFASGKLLFVREGALLAQPFDTVRLEVTGDAEAVAESVGWSVAPWNYAAFSVSGTGTLTYRLGGGNRSQFVWIDRSGREAAAVGPRGNFLSPALSPDGSRLAFAQRDDQPAGDIWTLDLATDMPARFTSGAETEVYPIFSADGSAIIYSSARDGIVMKPLVGAGQPRLVLPLPRHSAMLIPTQVTRAGELVLFGDLGTGAGFDILTMPMSGGAAPAAIVTGPQTQAEPHVSADGKWIAYASILSGTFEVFVEPFPPTGAKWQISKGGGRQPMWREDGRELFFVTNDRKFYAVDVRAGMTFDVGARRFLFDMPANTISVRNSYIPSKDGQRFLVNKSLETAVSPIHVVVNWM